MKRIGIYGSINVGNVHKRDIEYIAVDQGVMNLLNQGIRPLFVIGDLDSLENKDVLQDLDIKVFPCIKDDTDTALAVREAVRRGYAAIDIYGVTKKRLDHFMAVLCLLRQYDDIKITIYDEYNKIYLLKKGKHLIQKDNYYYFSLFSYEPTLVTLKDCHYPLDHYLLDPKDPLCVSNQINDQTVEIEVDHDVLFIQSQ